MYFTKPTPQSSDTGDKKLIKWDKREKPIIPHPPENMKLTGFRDPYIIQRGNGQNKWKMLLGSGIEGQGGTLLVYEASQLDSGSRATHALAPAQRQPLFTSVFNGTRAFAHVTSVSVLLLFVCTQLCCFHA